MAFHVNWKPSAHDRLIEIWIAAEDQSEVGRAADAIDAQLRADPLSFGEERSGMLRLGIVRPLAVMVEVFPADLRVDVLGVRHADRRSS